MNETSEHNGGEVVLYQSPGGEVRLDVRLEHETIWLTQKQMAQLFDTSTDNVGLHLKNVCTRARGMSPNASVGQALQPRRGHLSAGYRVNSARTSSCARPQAAAAADERTSSSECAP